MSWFRTLVGPDQGADTQQLCVRAVFLFVFGIVCVRIAGRRTFAHYSPLDIVVALIVGSNIGRMMTGKADLVPAGSATLVLVALHRLLAIASMRWRFLSLLVKERPLQLVVDGEVDRSALRRANLSDDDLREALRMERVGDPSQVRAATLEGSGKVSVLPKDRRPSE